MRLRYRRFTLFLTVTLILSCVGLARAADSGLLTTLYNNADFTNLKVVRIDPVVDFNWGTGAPSPGMDPDTFSIRWDGQVEAPVSGIYTFYTQSDDGVRLWVNRQALVNNWTPHGSTENSGTIALVGGQRYEIRLEYFENSGYALLSLKWQPPGGTKTVIPAERLFAPPPGTSPVPSAPLNVTIPQTTQRTLLLAWQQPPGVTSLVGYALYRNGAYVGSTGGLQYQDTALTPGTTYTYTLSTLDANGGRSPFTAPVTATTLTTPPAGTGTGLQGSYYGTADLNGRILVRTDATVNFNFGTGAPATGVSSDNFSIRWEGQVQPLYTQAYTFYTVGDDGVRLWVDGQLLTNDWSDHGPRESKGQITLSAGRKYDLRMEYYERTGGAVAQLLWESSDQAKGVIPASQLYPAQLGEVKLLAGPASTVSPMWVEGRNTVDVLALRYSLNGGAAQDVVRENSMQWYVDTASAQGLPFGIPLNPNASTALSVTSLSVGPQTYYYRIRATNAAGDSAYTYDASTPTTVPVGPPGYIYCASENQTFTLAGVCDVAYGANGKFNYLSGRSGSITFNNATFGDPISGTAKAGFYRIPSDRPIEPGNLKATIVSTNRIDLSWTDNASNETGFKLERKLGVAGAWVQIATLPANTTSHSSTDAVGCGSSQTKAFELVWTPTKLNGKSWSTDELVIRANDSLLFTVEDTDPGSGSGNKNGLVKIDADGNGTVDYHGAPEDRFPWKYTAPGHYTVHAWLRGRECGTLTVTVVDVNLDGPIACEVGHTRNKSVSVNPATSKERISFTSADGASLLVSRKDWTSVGATLALTSVQRGTPILQARLGGTSGPLIRQQEVDEFTMQSGLAKGFIFYRDEEGFGHGNFILRMTPKVPDLTITIEFFVPTMSIEGQSVYSFNSNALTADGLFEVPFVMVPGSSSTCHRIHVTQQK